MIIPPNDQDIDTAVRTLFGEARGEPVEGQLAVSYVIRTRAELGLAYMDHMMQVHPLFGNGSLFGVCRSLYQFSCWSDASWNAANLAAMKAIGPNDTSYQNLSAILRQALNGIVANPAPGATHYRVSSTPWPEDWGREVQPIATIGHHSFYKIG